MLALPLLLQKTKKKKKKEKKDKREKRKKKKEYIETEGITTPSKEQVPPSLQAPTPAAYKLPVCSNKHIRICECKYW